MSSRPSGRPFDERIQGAEYGGRRHSEVANDESTGDNNAEEGGTPAEGINDRTGEFGPGVDQDTGAAVGDTGTPELADADGDAADDRDAL